MEVLVASLCFGMLFFSMESQGQELTQFFTEHKAEIQDYIMAGHGRDWLDCDVLSLSRLTIGDAPQFMMDFETFDKLDLRSTLSSSHCLLAAYHVESKELREYTSEMKRQLSTVEFGRLGWAPWAILLNSYGYGYRVAIFS